MKNNSPIIKASQIPEKYAFKNMETPEQNAAPDISVKLEKARKYDRMMILLEASERHYEHIISLTKGSMNKEMENPSIFTIKAPYLAMKTC